MPTLRTILFAAAVAAVAGAPAARADGPAAPAPAGAARRLTFEDAVALAAAQNPGVALATEKAAGVDARGDKAKAHRLPVLTLRDEAHQFTKEYDIPFQLSSAQPPAYFKAYDAFTNTFTVILSEPLTGQLVLGKMIDADDHLRGAALADVDKARLDAAFGAADGYVRVLEARAAADVAHQTVAQIQGELDRALKLRAADSSNDIDVLRFKSAKAAADQAAVRADTAAATATAAFVVALGLHDGDAVEVVDDLPAQPPPLALTIEQAQARALGQRADLHAARERIGAADASRKAAYAGYVPDVRAEAVYFHNTGFHPFQPDDAAFLGLTASWNVWDWGATASDVAVARHEEQSAQIAADALVDQVRLDVRRRWLDAKAGLDNLAAADTQLQTAEEAYRLQKARFDAGAATTTDVLDAETDVARARLTAASARYDYMLGLIALARAIGDVPAATGAP